MIRSVDLETHLIKPGMIMPRMVCLTFAQHDLSDGIFLRDEGLRKAKRWLKEDTFVGQNICFDLGVLCAEDEEFIPLVFQALDEGRIRDTLIRQKLLDNATGELKFLFDEESQEYRQANFSLQNLVKRHLNKFLPKGEDTYRKRYNELDGVPLDQWPQKAIDYAIGDAIDTLAVYDCQQKIIDVDHDGDLPGEASTMQAAWALHLMGAWGLRTDGEMVKRLKGELEIDYADAVKRAQAHGLVRANGKRDMKAIREMVQEHYLSHGLKVPLTKKGQISTDRDCLSNGRYPSVKKNSGLVAVSDVVRVQKLLKTYVPVLERGTSIPVTPNYNVLVESFRTSCSSPNVQNPPRKGGVRECFWPRENFVYVFCDYSTLELRTLAQTCLDLPEVGFSRMAEALREGRDLHIDMAAAILGGMNYEEALKRYKEGDPILKEARGFAKVLNFGAPGGLGAATFVEYARASGINIDEQQAKDLIALYKRNWPEMEKYFNYISNLCSDGEAEYIIHPRTKMVRGRVRYTAAANHGFQTLAGVGSKDAVYQVSRECYLPELSSSLFGCRPVLFLHDEIGMEVPYQDAAAASSAADRLRDVMVERMSFWCPDIPIEAAPVMIRRWLKSADPVRVNGMLVPSRFEGNKWVADA